MLSKGTICRQSEFDRRESGTLLNVFYLLSNETSEIASCAVGFKIMNVCVVIPYK